MEEKTIEEVVVDKNESTTTTQEKPVEEKVQVKKKRGRPSLKRQLTDDVIKVDLSKPIVKKEETGTPIFFPKDEEWENTKKKEKKIVEQFRSDAKNLSRTNFNKKYSKIKGDNIDAVLDE